MKHTQVLIVGAGPTGLVLALWLSQQGVAVRIIEKAAGPGTTSRALAVHARTLELYRQMHLDAPIVEQGYTVPGARLWLGGQEKARVPFNELVSDLTPYGFLHIYPQDEHERLLLAKLDSLDVHVEYRVELVNFSEQDGKVAATLRVPDGTELSYSADFVAGC
ncbi:MAG: FAD-dependent oxidoreductase, partial [Sinobacteraceae bacterium]|nr:FAD-dependent oxidoreductase [Nevskiaceae bacterium]